MRHKRVQICVQDGFVTPLHIRSVRITHIFPVGAICIAHLQGILEKNNVERVGVKLYSKLKIIHSDMKGSHVMQYLSSFFSSPKAWEGASE